MSSRPASRPSLAAVMLGLCGGLLGAPGAAEAAPKSEAGPLFERGLVEMQAGRYASACPAFEQSYALEPLPGVLFTLAECEAGWGKLATAIGHYQRYLEVLPTLPAAQRERHAERAKVASEKIAALNGLVPELTIRVPDGAPAGVVVKRNGEVVAPTTYGIARGVDPGDYLVEAELGGKPIYTRRLTLRERDRAQVDVPLPGQGSGGAAKEPQPAVTKDEEGSGLQTAGFVVGGIGVASLAVGLITGGLAMGTKGTIEDNCPDRRCTPEGRDAVDQGQTYGLVSTITFAVGLAGIAAGVIMLIMDGVGDDEETVATPGLESLEPVLVALPAGGELGLQGRW